MVNSLVTVIIPSFNRGHLICNALESVRRQSHRPIEILVIDDGSTDDTKEIVGAWRNTFKDSHLSVVYRRQSNAGVSAARNQGIKLASGTIIQFLDSDDAIHVDKIAHQYKALRSKKGVRVVFSARTHLNSPEDILRVVSRPREMADVSVVSGGGRALIPAHLGQSLILKSVFRDLGLLDERLDRHEDWEYLVRIVASDIGCAYLKGHYYFLVNHPGERLNDLSDSSVCKPRFAIEVAQARLNGLAFDEAGHIRAARELLGQLACAGLVASVRRGDVRSANWFRGVVRESLSLRDLRLAKAAMLYLLLRINVRVAQYIVGDSN